MLLFVSQAVRTASATVPNVSPNAIGPNLIA
jgi:hypothetical protein